MSYYYITHDTDYLEHHGIKGQKWGIRHYQNEDGSLTTEGRLRYDTGNVKTNLKNFERDLNKMDRDIVKQKYIRDTNAKKAEELEAYGKDSAKEREREAAAKKAIHDGEKHTKALINNAKNMGYSVNEFDARRAFGTARGRIINSAVTVGLAAVDGILFGPQRAASMLVVGSGIDIGFRNRTNYGEGKGYKVRAH